MCVRSSNHSVFKWRTNAQFFLFEWAIQFLYSVSNRYPVLFHDFLARWNIFLSFFSFSFLLMLRIQRTKRYQNTKDSRFLVHENDFFMFGWFFFPAILLAIKITKIWNAITAAQHILCICINSAFLVLGFVSNIYNVPFLCFSPLLNYSQLINVIT